MKYGLIFFSLFWSPLCLAAESELTITVPGISISDQFIIDEDQTMVSGPGVLMLEQALAPFQLRPQFKVLPLIRGFQMVSDGKIDAILNIAQTKSREGKFLYPKNYLFEDEVVLISSIKRGLVFKGNLKELPQGTRIAISGGFDPDGLFEGAENLQIDEFHNSVGVVGAVVGMLYLDRVDFLLNPSRQLAEKHLENYFLKDRVEIQKIPVQTRKYYLAFRPNFERKDVFEAVDQAILGLRAAPPAPVPNSSRYTSGN